MFWRVTDWIRPPIISDWPDGISTVLEMRRTVRAGMTMVLAPPTPMEKAPLVERSETSAEMRSEMRPPDRTTGVTFRPTP